MVTALQTNQKGQLLELLGRHACVLSRVKCLLRNLRKFSKNCEAVAAMEFAILLPLMVTLYFGAIEISQLVHADRRVTNSTSTMADLTARLRSVTICDIEDIFMATRQIADGADMAGLSLRLSSIVENPGGQPVVQWSQARNMQATQTDEVIDLPEGLLPESGSIIKAELNYTYKGLLGYQLPESMNLTETYYLRPRASDTVEWVGPDEMPSNGDCGWDEEQIQWLTSSNGSSPPPTPSNTNPNGNTGNESSSGNGSGQNSSSSEGAGSQDSTSGTNSGSTNSGTGTTSSDGGSTSTTASENTGTGSTLTDNTSSGDGASSEDNSGGSSYTDTHENVEGQGSTSTGTTTSTGDDTSSTTTSDTDIDTMLEEFGFRGTTADDAWTTTSGGTTTTTTTTTTSSGGTTTTTTYSSTTTNTTDSPEFDETFESFLEINW